MSEIADVAGLRKLYGEPRGRAVTKQLARIDRHCRRFIELSPFLVMATGRPEGPFDASPRGGEPGFVQVRDEGTLLLADSPGNNRLDSMQNLVACPHVGLLFMIPGIEETLRVNGRATIRDDAETLARFAGGKRLPKVVIEVSVLEAYLHCAKAFMRSRLWDPSTHVDRAVLPTTGEILREQTGSDVPPETQDAMRERYRKDL